jgi:general secretion pathway protein H
MARKAELEQRLILLRQTMTRGSNGESGFTLLEMVCILAIIAMLAAVLLPNIPRDTSRPRLEAYAVETASLLKADRTAAIRHRVQIATQIDAGARSLRSGSTGQILRVPDDVVFDAILPNRCNERPAFSTISFFPTGMSCGGTILLSRLGATYEIRVNWLTGGIEIASNSKL